MSNITLLAKYVSLIKNLFPRGIAWRIEPNSTLSKLVTSIAGEYCRVDERNQVLLRDAFPDVTQELLTDWETTLGIPDECTTLGSTNDKRRLQLVQKLTTGGGQNAAFYVEIGSQLGFAITVTDFKDFRAGLSRVGDRINNELWTFFFEVKGPATINDKFLAGRGRAGDRLLEVGNATLECTINKLKPAHTRVLFTFTGT